ncbi:hypothetical protein BA190_11120 [Labrys sp. WJW]|uniref:hypothetical protein n=1 Tax=Labrys sp. WJW TaxID=1737983 RepID=UPI000834E4C7|nr:hypothetical protein [Labrys sp. WJW]OCC04939.1 hypothetical protein BA190_11120 [Labrys sp. WJW]
MKREQIWLKLTLGCDPAAAASYLLSFVVLLVISPLLRLDGQVYTRVMPIYLGSSAACWYYALEVARHRVEAAKDLLVPRLDRYAVEGLLISAAAQTALPSLIIGLCRRSLTEGLVCCAIQACLAMGGLVALRTGSDKKMQPRVKAGVLVGLAAALFVLEETGRRAEIPHFFEWAVLMLTLCLIAIAMHLYWPATELPRLVASQPIGYKVKTSIGAVSKALLVQTQPTERKPAMPSSSAFVFEPVTPPEGPVSSVEALRCLLWRNLNIGFGWRQAVVGLRRRFVVVGLIAGIMIGFDYFLAGNLNPSPNFFWFFLAIFNSSSRDQDEMVSKFNQDKSSDREFAALMPMSGQGQSLKVGFLGVVISPAIQDFILDALSINIGMIIVFLYNMNYALLDFLPWLSVINILLLAVSFIRARFILKDIFRKGIEINLKEEYTMIILLPFALALAIILAFTGSFAVVVGGLCMVAILWAAMLMKEDLRVYYMHPHPFLPKR